MLRIAAPLVLTLLCLRAQAAEAPPAKAEAPPVAAETLVLFAEGVQLKLQEKYAEAIEKFAQVVARDKESAEAYFEMGFCHYRLGKSQEAAAALKRALELDPENGPAHETLAFVYNAMGARDKALDELEAAARAAKRPRNHEGLVQRIAWIYERQGDYKNAIKWYQYLLDCGYRDRKSYLALGILQLKSKLYEDALASFREVIRRTSSEEPAVDDVAAAYGQLTEAERAEALRRHEATAANSDDPATLEALALAYQAAGRTDEMLRTLERAASVASARTETQKEFLAEHFEEAGDLPRAIEWRLKILASRKNPPAEGFLRLAALYAKHEEMEKAADAFRKALAAEPRRRDLLTRVADCYAELYQWDRAAAVLEEFLKDRELGPADAEAVFDLAQVYEQAGKADLAKERKAQAFGLLAAAVGKSQNKATEAQLHLSLAELYYNDKQPDKALGYLLIAQQLDDADPRKLLLLAGGYKRVQNWTEAAATLEKYLEKDSKSFAAAAALYEMSTCLACAGKAEAAEAARERAAKLLLDLAEASRNDAARAAVQLQLGEMDLQRNQPKTATEHLLEALRLDPKQSLAHLHLAQCYQMLGDWSRAAAHTKSYLDATGGGEARARILYRLGVAQTRSGQPDLGKQNKLQAIQLLTEALATLEREQRGTPTHKAEIYRDLAGLYAGEKDLAKALDAIQRAIQLAPAAKRADYQLVLASLLDDLKRHDESEKVLLEAYKAEPTNPSVLNHLGYFYAERAKSLDQAVDLVKKALHYEPLNGAYLDSLGWAYYQQGKHQEALELLLRAVRHEEDAVIRDHLGDAYHKLGKLAEAREAWAQALLLDPEIEGVAQKLKDTEPPAPPKAPEKGEKP
ncbi:MAG TPA: tetratricopeptide repeat protein [Planctomycetota bacterium]|nr:tetratricopeptide repeat protein [Planctomycetota bacterium]HRR79006.1 tetratricopeptide repeat protein [Planctomycetota bacterium]